MKYDNTDFRRIRFQHWFGWGKKITGGTCERRYSLPKYQAGVVRVTGCCAWHWRLLVIKNYSYNEVKIYFHMRVSPNVKYPLPLAK